MKLTVNGVTHEIDAGLAEMRLLDWLREELGLTGAKAGCEIGACGACTVLVDGRPVKSCTRRLRDVAGKSVLTIEGLTPLDGSLHPLQQAFLDAGAVQCGFCTPGMILAAHALLLRNPAPARAEIRQALQGNLCRCTGYQQIIDAVELAAKSYQK
ncbi:MAG: 4-hydroxybenzoyl-CoA reductase subunit gamma [bacterium ADurb.Bin431]|nr:MAG: 4-hydroxybenzoyl-CoA reductase subunit gamma [bacterium ADurb.Bin431]HNY92666.1 (2Fe-2S)-binding protein [bacterium]HOH07771.1 (2Fe-2S)-binding protein [bacterium]HOY43705.1 (2Fe-2S)-binding protein [bacterium]HPG82145.1 (2Fe-2S)-binding protein [bacterium]